AVAALARRWMDTAGGLVAGLLFAVHPVHVEAVANVVGRAELMAAVFVVLAVYAALGRAHAGWSAVALAFGLLSKENAAVAPALVVWARDEARRVLTGLDRGRPAARGEPPLSRGLLRCRAHTLPAVGRAGAGCERRSLAPARGAGAPGGGHALSSRGRSHGAARPHLARR